MNNKQQQCTAWFEELRDKICTQFELIDQGSTFIKKEWHRPGGGGGVMAIMRGKVFEKVGVNVSTVYGQFSEQFCKEMPGANENPNFWASGISVVAHLCSPLVPAVHMNTRYIVTSKPWFGGGSDLTPIYPNDQDTNEFHAAFKTTCDSYNKDYYPKFKKWADEYFFLPHRGEPRGVGGIFYDNLDTNNWEEDFNFTKDVGKTFFEVYPKIVIRNMHKKWTPEQREYQLLKRGRYAEFNLLFDRGTRFGVMTNGNVDAYMMSMPPEVKWC